MEVLSSEAIAADFRPESANRAAVRVVFSMILSGLESPFISNLFSIVLFQLFS